MPRSAMERFRALCLALPEAYEQETWGEATFRVRGKIFAMAADHEGGSSVCMKVTREEQAALLASGEPFFFPRYVGSKGWIGIQLAAATTPWDEVGELVRESFRLVAPRSLGRELT